MKKRRITIIIDEIDDDVNDKKIITKVENILQSEYVDFFSCANYLIQFFYKTGKKYSCGRTKISKLLSILAFKYACKGIILFDEPIYRYPNCGTNIKSSCLLYRDTYIHNLPMEDQKKMISKNELNSFSEIPKEYQKIDGLSSEIKMAIEDVFYNFGAYSRRDLSELLNPIVEYDGICNTYGQIKLQAISSLDASHFVNNKVVDYLFKS